MPEIVQLKKADDNTCADINILLDQLTSGRTCSLSHLEKVVQNSNTELWVAKRDGKIIGMVTLAVIVKPGGITVQFEDVVVDESMRGQGLGKMLCEKAVERAKALGARSIHLTSRPDRIAANKLYQKLGFVIRETNVYRLAL